MKLLPRHFFHIVMLILIGLTIGCTSSKPIYYNQSYPDYNERIKVSKPKYKKKLNLVGYGLIATSTAAGAFGGYQSNFIVYNNSKTGERQTNKSGNAVLGGLVGFGTSTLFNYLFFRKDKLLSVSNNEIDSWVRKFDKRYIPIESESSSHSIMMIPKDGDRTYQFKDINDARIFKNTFPNSLYLDDNLKKSFDSLNKSDLSSVIQLFPNANESLQKEMKTLYISYSRSLQEYINSISKFADVRENEEDIAMELIKSMDDVKLYIRHFKNYNKEELVDRAKNYATTFSDVKYFNNQFPNSSYQSKVIKELLPKCSDDQLIDLVNTYPTINCIDEIKIAYLCNTTSVDEFLKRNNKYHFFQLRDFYDYSNANSVKELVESLNSIKEQLNSGTANKLISDAKNELLQKVYTKRDYSNKEQEAFIAYTEMNGWLRPESANYVRKAKSQIQKNIQNAETIANELDDIYRYVDYLGGKIETADGKELSFWQKIQSTSSDVQNKLAFVKATFRNNGKYPKKVKVKATLNFLESKKGVWASKTTINEDGMNKYYYLEILPNSNKDIFLMYEYTSKYRNTRHGIWGTDKYDYNVNSEDPVTIDYSYFSGTIPYSQDNELKSAKKAYANKGRSISSGSLYQVTTTSHDIISKSSDARIDVTHSVRHADIRGCISIFSNNNESSAYSSSVLTSNNYTKNNYSDASDDNAAGCYDSSDFPLTIKVSYISKKGKSINGMIRLYEYNNYDIRVEEY